MEQNRPEGCTTKLNDGVSELTHDGGSLMTTVDCHSNLCFTSNLLRSRLDNSGYFQPKPFFSII